MRFDVISSKNCTVKNLLYAFLILSSGDAFKIVFYCSMCQHKFQFFTLSLHLFLKAQRRKHQLQVWIFQKIYIADVGEYLRRIRWAERPPKSGKNWRVQKYSICRKGLPEAKNQRKLKDTPRKSPNLALLWIIPFTFQGVKIHKKDYMPCVCYLLIIEAVDVDSLRKDFLVAEYRIQ